MSKTSRKPSKRPPLRPLILGYAETVDLPDWHINGLRAKADTGARTSALHVDNIEKLPGNRVRFDIVLHRRKQKRLRHVEAHITRISHVRSSTGSEEERYFVRTTLRLGEVVKEIEVSLAARHGMQYRMLLGRSALEGDFVVDPARRYVGSERPNKKRKKLTEG